MVVVVDNDSTDGTASVAREFGSKVVGIGASEFSWGRALNRGLDVIADKAEVALLLSADANPANDRWIECMTSRFVDPSVVAVYGRQIPRADAPVDEVVRLQHAFDDEPRALIRQQLDHDLASGRWVCSHACAAIRVSACRELRFDEQSPGAEERPWVYAMIDRGHQAWYEPSAAVFHSHRESVMRFAFREWELARNHRGNRTKLVFVSRFCARLVLRRARNCLKPGVGARRIVVGVIRLPAEVACILLIACVSASESRYRDLRQWAWS